jgi:magnesium transporter
VVSLRDLILAPRHALIRDVMDKEPVAVKVTDDREHAAQELARYDLLALPVVDDARRLVGIVTHDDVMDVVVEEATEDVHRLGAVGPIAANYLEANFFLVWRSRAFWLACLIIGGVFTVLALAQFQSAIAEVALLALFIPLCISTGGNSGSQAATLITRALALGQVTEREWLRVLRHEVMMGVVLGASLGLIGFAIAVVTHSVVPQLPEQAHPNAVLLGLVIFQAVLCICTWGTLVGSMLPLVFRRLGIDPGIASSPFVATLVDVTGILIYFTIARLYLLP